MTAVSAPSVFTLRGRVCLKALQACLGTDLVVRKDAALRCERTLLDSFDWRLYGAGAALEHRVAAGASSLVWATLAGAEIDVASPAGEAPRRAADLPAGPLRERLGPLLGPRALLPRVKLRGKQRRLRVLTRSGEPVAQLEIREERRRGKAPMPGSLRVLAEPGREARAAAVRSQLVEELRLVLLDQGPVIAALEAAGARPGAYSPSVEVPLEPAMPAERATRAILRRLLDTLQANVPGVCRNLDSEFLHDFRVAVRRTRTALAQLRGTLPARAVAGYRDEFTWLGQITSTARDMDVYLLAFDDYRQALPADLQAALEPLRALLLEIRDREYAALRAALQGARYRGLVRRFARFLSREAGARTAGREAARPRRGAGVPASGDATAGGRNPHPRSPSPEGGGVRSVPPPPGEGSGEGLESLDGLSPHRGSDPSGSAAGSPLRLSGLARPVGGLARERLWSLYREVLGEGSAIHPESPPDELHELRKTCKKLRYLMEFFVPLFPRQEIQALIGVLKKFQDNLGEIQDLRVQQESLTIFAHQLNERGATEPRTCGAIDWLIAHQGETQRQARAAFAVRFASFAAEENRVRFHGLFGPNGPLEGIA